MLTLSFFYFFMFSISVLFCFSLDGPQLPVFFKRFLLFFLSALSSLSLSSSPQPFMISFLKLNLTPNTAVTKTHVKFSIVSHLLIILCRMNNANARTLKNNLTFFYKSRSVKENLKLNYSKRTSTHEYTIENA